MAQHQSAKKRIRQDAKKRIHNRYYKKAARSAMQKLRVHDFKMVGASISPVPPIEAFLKKCLLDKFLIVMIY